MDTPKPLCLIARDLSKVALGDVLAISTTAEHIALVDAIIENDSGALGGLIEKHGLDPILDHMAAPLFRIMLAHSNLDVWRLVARHYDLNQPIMGAGGGVQTLSQMAVRTCDNQRLSELLEIGVISVPQAGHCGLLSESTEQFLFWLAVIEERARNNGVGGSDLWRHLPLSALEIMDTAQRAIVSTHEIRWRADLIAKRWVGILLDQLTPTEAWINLAINPPPFENTMLLWPNAIVNRLRELVVCPPMLYPTQTARHRVWTAAMIEQDAAIVDEILIEDFIASMNPDMSLIDRSHDVLWQSIKGQLARREPWRLMELGQMLGGDGLFSIIRGTLSPEDTERLSTFLSLHFRTATATAPTKKPGRL